MKSPVGLFYFKGENMKAYKFLIRLKPVGNRLKVYSVLVARKHSKHKFDIIQSVFNKLHTDYHITGVAGRAYSRLVNMKRNRV